MSAPGDALDILRRSARLALSPGLRPWVILPVLANALLFGTAYWWAGSTLAGWVGALLAGWALEGWLAFLNPLISLLAGLLQLLIWLVLLALMASTFTYVVQLVAAPFMGFLASATDQRQHGPLGLSTPPDEGLVAMAWRTTKREVRKTWYWLWRALLLLVLVGVLSLIPGLNLIAPVIWFLWSGWMLGVQYIDYGADNRLVPFSETLAQLRGKRALVTSFGAMVLGLTMLPLINLVIMPIAVIGGTLLWLEHGRHEDRRAP
ncbi:sulfate transporter CysZ [Alcanivorax sp. JB21]|uniref:sulfate transporter CysZ n=1 Tax=Alcanivorax limicola TaxID=2874102 RepID=UPI001CBC18BD|nr:sulfate transporter CysZ [Alcanivorax limicola]MBZ2189918.1 sulfate transporter CysZ [Alcanivorax limicola]